MSTMETPNKRQQGQSQKGFTLIELSIVLVIIGLIVGGVLVGQDLIKASEIRATVGQVEKYNAAINTFRTKYNGMPGDLVAATAGGFQLFQFTAPGVGLGDGNGLIEGGTAEATAPIGETLAFWRHLSDASLIDGGYGMTGNSLILASNGHATGDVTLINNSLPPAKVGRGNSFVVYNETGFNYYQLAPISGIASNAYTYGSAGITPIEAYNMDVKIDDGAPNTGVARARGIAAINVDPSFNSGALADRCTNGASATSTASTYNRTIGTGGNDPSCSIRFRFN